MLRFGDLTIAVSDQVAWADAASANADINIVTPSVFDNPGGLCTLLDVLDSNGIYLDPVFGIAIGMPNVMQKASSFLGSRRLKPSGNAPLQWIRSSPAVVSGGAVPWYLKRLGGWPARTGQRATVAVIDSGANFLHTALVNAGKKARFESLVNPGGPPDDFNGHGTCCVGLIAASDECGPRIGVAPDCNLVVGQVVPGAEDGAVATAQLLLLACWAVHACGAKIISFSLGATRCEIESSGGDIDALSKVAWRLRNDNKALLFCAAGNHPFNAVLYPAACSGVIPVSGYVESESGVEIPNHRLSGLTHAARADSDLLLGPSRFLTTTVITEPGNRCRTEDFGDSSGACSFVAGVAALYLDKYHRYSLNEIISKMRAEARQLESPYDPLLTWPAVSFPRELTPATIPI